MQNPLPEVMKVPRLTSSLLNQGFHSIQTYPKRHGKEDTRTNATITSTLMRPLIKKYIYLLAIATSIIGHNHHYGNHNTAKKKEEKNKTTTTHPSSQAPTTSHDNPPSQPKPLPTATTKIHKTHSHYQTRQHTITTTITNHETHSQNPQNPLPKPKSCTTTTPTATHMNTYTKKT